MISYGFKKTTDLELKECENKIADELKKEGFGILTRIDLKEKFKEKLGIEFEDYIILSACNPPSAHQAILAEEDIGLFLPCNIILYKKNQQTVVSFIKPKAAMGMIQNNQLLEIAEKVEQKLERVFNQI